VSLQLKDVPGEAACSALTQKQREAPIAAATKLKMLRLRNSQHGTAASRVR